MAKQQKKKPGGGGVKTEKIRLLNAAPVRNGDNFDIAIEAMVTGMDGKVKPNCPLTLYEALAAIGAGQTGGDGKVVFNITVPISRNGKEIEVRAQIDGSSAEVFLKIALPEIEEKKLTATLVEVREEEDGFIVELALKATDAGQPTAMTAILSADSKELARVDIGPTGQETTTVKFPQSEGGKEKTVSVQWHRADEKADVKVQLPVPVKGTYSKSIQELAKANLRLWKKEPRRIWQHFGAATVMFCLAAWIFSAAGAGNLGLIFAIVCAIMAGKGAKRMGVSLGLIPLVIVGGIGLLAPQLIAEPMFYALLTAYTIGGVCYFVEALTTRPDGTPVLNWYPKLATIVFVGLIVFALMGGFVSSFGEDEFASYWASGDFQETGLFSLVGDATRVLYKIPLVGGLFEKVAELLERAKYAIVFLLGLMIMLAYAGASEGFQKLFGGAKKPAEAGKKDGAPSMGKLIQSDIIGEGVWAAISKGLAGIFMRRGDKKK
ncbi:MAG: hypothetical protein PHT51_00915 [Patescibacteria group bacterium]|nr:hypothetical protein [Patescibacteria group bacterium]MDD4610579.1 hypothetical protein [Patescibacteria group bacterium]